MDILKRIHNVPIDKIADAIMENNNIQFKNRIVRCWSDAMKCPKYAEQGNYGNDICEGCE